MWVKGIENLQEGKVEGSRASGGMTAIEVAVPVTFSHQRTTAEQLEHEGRRC